MDKFHAYRVFEENGKSRARRVRGLTLDELDAGEVVIQDRLFERQFQGCADGTGAGQDHPQAIR